MQEKKIQEGKKSERQEKREGEKKEEKKNLSEVGFEPTPTRVDCDLNAAP